MFELYSLDQILEMGLLSLYEEWDLLPRYSAKRYLERLRSALADQLDEKGLSPSLREKQIRDFWKAARRLPKVNEFAKESLKHLDNLAETTTVNRSAPRPGVRSALSFSQAPAPDFSPARLHLLATLLRDPDPAFYSESLYYVAQLPEAFDAIEKSLQKTLRIRPLPEDVNQQFVQLLEAHRLNVETATTYRMRCQAYLQTIDALNQIERVQIAIQSTLERYRKIKTHRGFESATSDQVTQSTTGEAKGLDSVTLFTYVKFPTAVKKSDVTPLIIQLRLNQDEESQMSNKVDVTFSDLAKPELIDVVVNASGFSEETTIWSRKIEVYSKQDSQPAIFLLKGAQEGLQRITIDFYHRGRHLSSGSFETHIYTGTMPPLSNAEPSYPQMHTLSANPPPPPDLELRITKGGSDNQLCFMLHSTKAKVGYHWKPFGEIQLEGDPSDFLEEQFERLSTLAAQSVDHLSEAVQAETIDTMQEMGLELFEMLLPEALQAEYWQRIRPLQKMGAIQSLLITSDEPWVPWELIRPYRDDPAGGGIEVGGFWAEDFQLSRWLAGHGPADGIEIKAAQIVAPELDLHYVRKEKDYFDRLKASGIQMQEPLQSKRDVIQCAVEGGIELLHFSTHGDFNSERPDKSVISLKGGSLIPRDLSTRKTGGLRRSRPLVFLNACNTGRMGTTLTGLGGWAKKFVENIEASAFIGSFWEVHDQLAAEFAMRFYDELQAGKTLGEAFHIARITIKEHQPANPTWLAYTLYGDPNSKVTWETNNQ